LTALLTRLDRQMSKAKGRRFRLYKRTKRAQATFRKEAENINFYNKPRFTSRPEDCESTLDPSSANDIKRDRR
jgi:hypothetical protein